MLSNYNNLKLLNIKKTMENILKLYKKIKKNGKE